MNKNITTNYYIYDSRLSLKSKGLLTYLLDQPEEWQWDLDKIKINVKEGIESIRKAKKELTDNGYLIGVKIRDSKGQMKGMNYSVSSKPEVGETNE